MTSIPFLSGDVGISSKCAQSNSQENKLTEKSSQLIHRLDQAKFLNLPPNPFIIYNHFNSIWLDDAPWKATEVGYAGWSEAYKHVKIPDINYGGNCM